jgi:hypothetical protein
MSALDIVGPSRFPQHHPVRQRVGCMTILRIAAAWSATALVRQRMNQSVPQK